MFTGLSGNTWETAKIPHESHNDVRRLCWHAGAIFVLLGELGLLKLLAQALAETLMIGSLWWGEGCTFPLPLWSSNRCESGETEDRGQGATARPLESGEVLPPPLLWTSPSRRLHLIYSDFKFRPHFKVASFAYEYVYPMIFTGGS